jgi:hypothetical protein
MQEGRERHPTTWVDQRTKIQGQAPLFRNK